MWERLRIGREQMDLLKMIEFSVVIPVYNEDAEIRTRSKAFYQRLKCSGIREVRGNESFGYGRGGIHRLAHR